MEINCDFLSSLHRRIPEHLSSQYPRLRRWVLPAEALRMLQEIHLLLDLLIKSTRSQPLSVVGEGASRHGRVTAEAICWRAAGGPALCPPLRATSEQLGRIWKQRVLFLQSKQFTEGKSQGCDSLLVQNHKVFSYTTA